MLCRRKHGNKGSFTCPFHGWSFSNTGKLLKVKDEDHGISGAIQYSRIVMTLKKLRASELSRLSFGSLNADAMPLEDYLGETKVIIDQIV